MSQENINKGMPAPEAKDAPKFSSEKPETLRRYLTRMEELFNLHKVVDERQKKKHLGRYANAQTEEEWHTLRSFATGSYEDFRKEIIENYPAAATTEGGSLSTLKRICRKYEGLEEEDIDKVMALRRAFLMEATKLSKTPVLASNRELVQYFLETLDRHFHREIKHWLSVPPLMPAFEEIKGMMASLLDTANTSSKMMQQFLSNQNSAPRPPRPQGFPEGPSGDMGQCHYCLEPGHFILKCPEREKHIAQGKIKLTVDNKIRLPDGTPIPREPFDKSLKDKVELHHTQRAALAYIAEGDYALGILPLPQSEQRTRSIYTNKAWDTQDELIENLQRQQFSHQAQSQEGASAPTMGQMAFAPPMEGMTREEYAAYVADQLYAQGINGQFVTTRRGAEGQGPSGF
ncbi:hypothetical protein AMATHDRAFT_143568 [Amanita thiersii Skay4041]|uniref:CCHC-type domain-containing protein n=1 Tax=Amanita thiersii Skay4041 TaxID=703135 RepID=A0A2A9NLU1_9AGAR|nr:hypothetical protein AMATHDRAFT_143568 [Amanita thiersii Skay4041]